MRMLARGGVAPLNAARTAQRAVPAIRIVRDAFNHQPRQSNLILCRGRMMLNLART